MESRMKRRSSFFRRDVEPEDESMSTTSTETTNTTEESAKIHQDQIREQYIKTLKAEQKAWKHESNQLKEQHMKLKKESKNSTIKTSKSDLYVMLSEKEKQENAILFSGTDYSSLMHSIDTLKKKVALVSIKSEHNAILIKEHLKRNSYQAQALFENLMNQIAVKQSEEIEWESDGESIDECLDSESEEVDM